MLKIPNVFFVYPVKNSLSILLNCFSVCCTIETNERFQDAPHDLKLIGNRTAGMMPRGVVRTKLSIQ